MTTSRERDLEAGSPTFVEERIPLVAFSGSDGDRDARESEQIDTDLPSSWEVPGKTAVWETQVPTSSVIGSDGTRESIKKCIHKCSEEKPGAFRVMKIKAKTGGEEINKDVSTFFQNIIDWKLKYNAICIYDAGNFPESKFKLIGEMLIESYHGMITAAIISNELLDRGKLPEVNDSLAKVVSIVSTSAFTGDAVSGSEYEEQFFAALESQQPIDTDSDKDSEEKVEVYELNSRYHCVLLLDDASKYDILQYTMAFQDLCAKHFVFSVDLVMNGSKEMLVSMANGSYFSHEAGILLIKSEGSLSSSLFSFVEACRNDSRMLEDAQKEFIVACQEYISESDDIDLGLIIENIKRNARKFSTHDGSKDDLKEAFNSATFDKSPTEKTFFLIDSSRENYMTLSNKDYFENNIETLVIFKHCGGLPSTLAKYLKDCIYEKELGDQCEFFSNEGVDLYVSCNKKKDDFLRNIAENRSKLKIYDPNDPEVMNIVERVKYYLEYCKWSEYVHELSKYITFCKALGKSDPTMIEDLFKLKIPIDTYIYSNIRFHWKDARSGQETGVAEHFKIYVLDISDAENDSSNGRAVNNAVAKLSNGIMADCFNEDGTPNLGIISPIQALIINRIFCIQLSFVKLLWKYDKQNALVNAVMIWILINGILKAKIFFKEDDVNDLIEARDHFASAVKKPLSNMLDFDKLESFSVLKCALPLFKGKALYQAAGDGKFLHFITHTTTKRCILAQWFDYGKAVVMIKTEDDIEKCSSKEEPKRFSQLKKPLMKLYIHMTMYVISYLMLAYCTLQPKSRASGIVQWLLFLMVSSFCMDELRQALGESQDSIQSSLRRWWSDNWNKLDFLSMMVYFIAFGLKCGGVFNSSQLLFSTFSFIWCLKFYQFLRAFESLGTYIILIQEMLPQLLNFAIVALIAMISYGVFLTSILFPKIKFNSWSVFIMILLRPYLLLFAETGINEYDLSAKNTIFATPKVPTASEILIILGMCIFLMFGGVLLLNLLIAIFSGIYEEVKEKSDKLWVLNNFELLQEFQSKPALPIPFSLPVNIFLIIRRLKEKAAFPMKDDDYTSAYYSWQHDRMIMAFEENKMDDQPNTTEKTIGELKTAVSAVDTKIEALEKQCQDISRKLTQLISNTAGKDA